MNTLGLADVLREALRPLENRIALSFVYGSTAKRTDTAKSDIDLMVVSDTVSLQDLAGALHESEAWLGRQVNPTLYTNAQFEIRRNETDSFVMRVLQQPRLFLIGGDHDLAEPRKPGEDRQAKGRAAGASGVGRLLTP